MNESCRTQTGRWETSATLVNRLVQTYKHIYPQNWPILGVLQCVAMRCSVLHAALVNRLVHTYQHMAMRCSVLYATFVNRLVQTHKHTYLQNWLIPGVLQCFAVCCRPRSSTTSYKYTQVLPRTGQSPVSMSMSVCVCMCVSL